MRITADADPITLPQAANDNLAPNQPLRLADAVRLCFPEGGMTKNGLMREVRRGRLVIEKIANKLFTTPSAIEEMRKLCRVKVEGRVCGGGRNVAKAARSSREGLGLLSTAVNTTPQAALLAKIEKRKNS